MLVLENKNLTWFSHSEHWAYINLSYIDLSTVKLYKSCSAYYIIHLQHHRGRRWSRSRGSDARSTLLSGLVWSERKKRLDLYKNRTLLFPCSSLQQRLSCWLLLDSSHFNQEREKWRPRRWKRMRYNYGIFDKVTFEITIVDVIYCPYFYKPKIFKTWGLSVTILRAVGSLQHYMEQSWLLNPIGKSNSPTFHQWTKTPTCRHPNSCDLALACRTEWAL